MTKLVLFVICTNMCDTELNGSVKFVLARVLLGSEKQALSSCREGDSLTVISSCLGTNCLTLQPLRIVPLELNELVPLYFPSQREAKGANSLPHSFFII